MPVLRMQENEMLKLFGPMSLTVISGEVEILNKKFKENSKIVIHRLRSYVMRSLASSELEVNMAAEAQIQQVEENEPYLEWLSVANSIAKGKVDKIVVLGGVDSGKSTFTVLLANTFVEKGFKPAVIDSDVGQADIGPPGFISMAYPEEQVIWMREYRPVLMRFIGDIKPQMHVEGVVHIVADMARRAIESGKKPVIIDTDGWIGDEHGINYKFKLVEELKPDTIVVLGSSLHGLFRRYQKLGAKIYELRSPHVKRTRSREERRMLRRDRYREYLESGKVVKVKLGDTIITGSPIFHGIELEIPSSLSPDMADKVLYITRTRDTLYLVVKNPINSEQLEIIKKICGASRLKTYLRGFERRLYVAISNGEEEYPALIEKIDYDKREIHIRTRHIIDIKLIKVSSMRLTEDYTEQFNTISPQ